MKGTPKLKSFATRAAIAAGMAVVMFGITGYAHANGGPASRHRENHGTLKIEVPTEVSGLLLQPGEYEVKAKNTATGGAVIEISRWYYDRYAAEGLPSYTSEVIATVAALPQAATSPSARTGLLLAAGNNGKAIGLQIRGQNLDYLF